ncbi:hypothetical protein PsorP6_011121 [Peronosclerospora sorghi]|uniref:Uncharacterized protein n=1 Tax=Peronosclerospora sorghi TaxID=230839 RepID=A0ACC0VWK6_9STRA|nr:hypothetical protein PsorP6_011121 [Peronosclerospora sorghi]
MKVTKSAHRRWIYFDVNPYFANTSSIRTHKDRENFTPTREDAQTLCQLMLADEHVMICFCGVDMQRDADTRVLQEAIRKIIRIKMKMGRNFTRDVAALVAEVPEALSLAEHNDVVDLDVLLSAASRYFSVQLDVVGHNNLNCNDQLVSSLSLQMDGRSAKPLHLILPKLLTLDDNLGVAALHAYKRASLLSQDAYEYLQDKLTDVLPALGTHDPMTDDILIKVRRIVRQLSRLS